MKIDDFKRDYDRLLGMQGKIRRDSASRILLIYTSPNGIPLVQFVFADLGDGMGVMPSSTEGMVSHLTFRSRIKI